MRALVLVSVLFLAGCEWSPSGLRSQVDMAAQCVELCGEAGVHALSTEVCQCKEQPLAIPDHVHWTHPVRAPVPVPVDTPAHEHEPAKVGG